MRHLILSVSIPALLLAACASGPAEDGVYGLAPDRIEGPLQPMTPGTARPPHLPADLTPAGVRAADDHLALEQVEGAEAMAFVAESNRTALAALEGDPRYERFRQQAFDILSATDRIPSPSFLGEGIGNFWQDAANPKGIWRRTSLESYRSEATRWETLLDIDAVAKAEGRDWVWKGADCLAPDETRCLISLSDGGKDAVTVREFDTTTGLWVEDGFILPEGKHRIEWLDRDTLLVATDFGEGTLTESGYPFIVKSLKRGQALAQATEVYRGDIGDGGYGVSPMVFRDKDGAVAAVIISRPLDTFRSETWELVDGRPVKLELPERLTIYGVTRGYFIFSNDEPWTFMGTVEAPAGSLLSPCLECLRPGFRGIPFREWSIFSPGPRESVADVRVLDDRVVVAISDNVVGRLAAFVDGGHRFGWTKLDYATPDNVAISLGDSSKSRDDVFVSTQGFLTPPTLSLTRAPRETSSDLSEMRFDASIPGFVRDTPYPLTELRTAPARFDATTHVVEQFEATSSDGTKIPYFVTRPRAMAMDGSAPAILFGYGGFQVSFPPAYKPEMGRLWLENGGVFVQANIRGGGEFGPEWHQSVLKENRQLAFDDFAAVARDLHRAGSVRRAAPASMAARTAAS